MAFDERALAKCALALCSRVWRLASYCLAPRLACRVTCALPVRPAFASYRLAPRLAYSVTCALPTRPTVGFISPCAAFGISHDLRFAGAHGFWLHIALRRVWLVVRLADAVCHASQGLLSVSCFAAASHNCLHCVQSFAYSAVCRFEEHFSAFAFPGHVTVLPRSADFAMPFGLCS